MFCGVIIHRLSLALCCLALFQVTVFASNEPEDKTFEPGENITLVCGNGSLSSSTFLKWTKDENILFNTTSHNISLVLSNLTKEDAGLYICTANNSKVLKKIQLVSPSDVQEETEQPPEEQDDGLSNVNYIAIALALGLTVFIIVFMAVFLYRAQRRRKNEYYKRRWRVNVNGNQNVAVEEENVRKPGYPINDFQVRMAPKGPRKSSRQNNRPAEYHWLETLGRDEQPDGNANAPGRPMYQYTAYV